MALTEIAVKQAKPKDKAYKLTDAGSLFLFISPSGGKSWRWRYYADDKQKLLTLGSEVIGGVMAGSTVTTGMGST
jgi:hypothetical protein